MAGNAVIGALRVNLGIDTAEFQSGLKSAKDGLSQFATAAKVAGAAIAAAFAAGVGAAVVRVEAMAVASRKLDRALANAGNAAKTSAAEVAAWADKLERRTGRAVEEVMAVGANLASFNFGEEVFFRAIELGDDMAAAWGGDLRGNLEGLSRALDDPINGFAMLRKRGIALTDAQAAMVEGLMKANDKLGAQKVVLEALEGQVKGVAEAGYQGMTKSLGNMVAAIDGFFDRIVEMSSAGGTMLAAGIDMVTASIDLLTENLATIGEYAAVAGGALALAFAPASFSAMISSFALLGQAGVAAMSAITAAIMRNPFGALAVALTVAVTSIYHFRDEIQQAIGLDVVGIVKDAANLVIGSFVAAFEDITFVWNNFGNILGAAVVAGVNIAIRAINSLVTSAKIAVNDVIGVFNKIPGFDIGTFDIGSNPLSEVDNPYAKRLGGAVAERNAAVASALSADYIGAIGRAFSGSTPAVEKFGAALSDVGEELDDIGGGGAGGKGGKAAKVKDAVDRVGQAMDNARQSLGQGFGSIFEGLVNKTLTWKDAIVQAGQALLKYLNQINIAQGGSGLFGGGFLQGLFGSLLGFQHGGSFTVGGSGGVDSQMVAFRASPGEMVDVRKGGQSRSGGEVMIRVEAEEGRMFRPVIRAEAQGVAVQVTQAAAPGIMRGAVSATQSASRNRPGFFR